MVKRTTAKHAKPKASLKKSKEKAAKQSDSLTFSQESNPSGAIGAEAAIPSNSINFQNAGATQAMPAHAAQQNTGVPAPAQPTTPGAQAAQVVPGVQPGQVTAAAPDAQTVQVQSSDQAAHAAVTPGAASQTAFTSSADLLNKKSARRRKTAKVLGITSLSLVGAIAAIYFVGVFVFSTHFMPNTHISDIDLTMKSAQEVQSDFEKKVGSYTVNVKGNGLNLNVKSDDADLKIDTYGIARDIFAAQNPWAWPIEVFMDHDGTETLTKFVSADSLSNLLKKEVNKINKTGTNPKNAYCDFNKEQNKYVIVSEELGTKLDADSVLKKVLAGVISLQDMVVLDSSTLVQPDVVSTDERLAKVAKKANELSAANLNIMVGGHKATTITGAEISKWIKISPKYKVTFDTDAMNEWVKELASKLNTVGSERKYKRADGKKITVSGGDYGWVIDEDALVSKLATKIKNGAVEDVEVPVLQKGTGFSGLGGKDWGKRYMDVDLSEQRARLYGDNGKIIWQSDIVSGLPTADRATPEGVYSVNLKGMNVTLVGRDSRGKVTYRTKVTYWMPFINNAIGFHDATWQSAFGGNRYTYVGSHGCINLSMEKAEKLYDIIKEGDVVVVHS